MPMGDVRREGHLSVYLKSAPEIARHFDLDQSDEHQ